MSSGAGRILLGACCAVLLGASSMCQRQRLSPPTPLASPYPGTQLWAVAPFANESGVSTVDTFRVADLFAEQLEQVQGIHAIPVNRVVAAMRAKQMSAIATAADAVALAVALDADAIVVGTVTVWDPYPPPTLGLAVQVFPAGSLADIEPLDPHRLVRAATGDEAAGRRAPDPAPRLEAACVLDSRNHQTLAWLDQFAAGRTHPDSPYGTEVYLVDMQLFTQFVSFRLLHDLLAPEQPRQQSVLAAPR